MKKTVFILSVLVLTVSSCGQVNSKAAEQASPNNEETTTKENEVTEDTVISINPNLDMEGNPIEVCQDTIINDTLFLEREKSVVYYHALFIDKNKSSKFYDEISCFGNGTMEDYEEEFYNSSLKYLKANNIILKRKIINELPSKWIIIYQYKGKFHTYCPSDFMYHYKINITDTAFIDYMVEGPVANKIIDFTKIDDSTFRFHLTGLCKQNRELVIHIIDSKNGIAVFEDKYINTFGGEKEEDARTTLMIDVNKIRNFPIIVNYCEQSKQNEFEFDKPDYKKLISRTLSK